MLGCRFLLLIVLGLTLRTISANLKPFTFSCDGKAEVAILENGISIKELCYENFQLSFNNSGGKLTDGHFNLYFSSKEKCCSASIPLMHEAIGTPHGVWESNGLHKINQPEMPCGTGYLIATIGDTHSFYEVTERAVKVCDHSDIDLELVSSAHFTSQVNLYAGSDHLGEQLKLHLGYPADLGVKNNGMRMFENTTIEASHMVGYYLRRINSTMSKHEHCNIPDATIYDSYLGILTFTDGIGPGDTHMFDHIPENMINVTFDDQLAICGDAELVIMLDPLKMENDSNPCNNFFQIPVHVHCSAEMSKKEMCKVFPNFAVQGHDIYAVFSSHARQSAYERKSTSPEEWSMLDSNDFYHRLGLMTMSRMNMVRKMLMHIYDDPNKGMCNWVERMFEEENREEIGSWDMSSMDPLGSSDSQVISIGNVLHSLKTEVAGMQAPRDMEDDFKRIETSIDRISDEMWKLKLKGISMGLMMSIGYKHTAMKALMGGFPVPEKITRQVFQFPIMGLAKAIHHYDNVPDYMKSMMVGQAAPYVAALHVMLELLPVPKTVEHKLHLIMSRMKMLLESAVTPSTDMPGMDLFSSAMPGMNFGSSTTPSRMPSSSQSECPFAMMNDLENINPISKELHYLEYTAAIEEDAPLEGKLERCHRNLVSAYLRYGGARVQSKDIVEVLMRMSGYPTHIPKSCRQHPLIPPRIFPMYWNVYKERIMEGTESPWTGKMFWKTAAFCQCDMCHGKTDMEDGKYDKSSSSSGIMETSGYITTDSYGYMKQTTDRSFG